MTNKLIRQLLAVLAMCISAIVVTMQMQGVTTFSYPEFLATLAPYLGYVGWFFRKKESD